MCADCHSTGLRKNYDPATNRFQTRWAEVTLAVKHATAPGSQHMKWAKATKASESSADQPKGPDSDFR